MAKLDPLPENPSPAELGAAIHQVHACVERGREESKNAAAAAAKARRAIQKQMSALRKALGIHADGSRDEGAAGSVFEQLDAIRKAVGVDGRGKIVRKTLFNMGQIEFVGKIGAFVTVIVIGLRVAAHFAPPVWALLQSLGRYLLHGA